MRILLVGNYALDNQASMLRYADMLRDQLSLRGHEVELVQPRVFLGDWAKQSTVRKWLGYIDKYVLFPFALRARARGFELVHVCDHSNSMYLAHTGGRPSSITCHDLLAIACAMGRYPQQRTSLSGRVQQRWILRHLAGDRDVVCVSSNTARELAGLSRREGGTKEGARRVVIPNALDPGCVRSPEEEILQCRARFGIGTAKYLFHIGGSHWYKNRAGVLRIFHELLSEIGGDADGLRLVMAGAPLSPEQREYVASQLPQDSVIEVVNPSDEDLWSLYSGAMALLFPSLYEGFGWPLIEAQRCGCPVITSNRAPMTEVAAAAALYIDPADERGAAVKIHEHLHWLASLREAGFENVARFDPLVVFPAYEGFFRGVLRVRRSTDAGLAESET